MHSENQIPIISNLKKIKIAVLIPAYNEEKNIENVLQDIQNLRKSQHQWTILPIVINDGSKDRTEQILSNIAFQYGAYPIHLPINLGIGRAVQTGFKFALKWGADIAIQLDGDGQHPADQIPLLIDSVLKKHVDVSVGSRYISGGGGNVSSKLRQTGTLFFSSVLKFLVGIEIKDTTSGFRAFNREVIEFFSKIYPDDYPEVEAYVLLARKKFRIQEVPIKMRLRLRGTSSITPFKSAYYMIKVLLAASICLFRPLPNFKQALPESLESLGTTPESAFG